MTNSEPAKLIDDLKELLGRQIKLARQGNVATVEQLSARCGVLVEEIKRLGLLDMPSYRHQRLIIEKLYHNLNLLLTSGKDEISGRLKQIRKAKMTVKSYHENLGFGSQRPYRHSFVKKNKSTPQSN